MGSWGTSVFANDTAADVRLQWRSGIARGADPATLTAEMIREWGPATEGAPDAVEFWTGLATAQMETGRLQNLAKDQALRLIEAGGDVELYEETGLGGRRRAVLDRLASKLTGPQPAPKRVRASRRQIDSGLRVGDLIEIDSADKTRSAYFTVCNAVVDEQLGVFPVLLGLYVPKPAGASATEIAESPFLGFADITGYLYEVEDPPHYMDGRGPTCFTLIVQSRADVFGPSIGRIVARDVARPRDAPAWSYCTLAKVAAFVGSRWYDDCETVTRRREAGETLDNYEQYAWKG